MVYFLIAPIGPSLQPIAKRWDLMKMCPVELSKPADKAPRSISRASSWCEEEARDGFNRVTSAEAAARPLRRLPHTCRP